MKKFKLFTILVLFVNQAFCQKNLSCADTTGGINKGLVFCLPFDGSLADGSGNGHNGTATGTSYIADKWGFGNSAIQFNGTSDYVTLSNNIPDGDSLTVSFWFKPEGVGSTPQYIFWEGDNECGNDFAVYIADMTVSVNASKRNSEINGTAPYGKITLTSSLSNTWHCFVWTMTPTESNVYIDCQKIATINRTASNTGHHSPFIIGCKFDGNGGNCGAPAGFFYKGGVDNFRLYNRTFASGEVPNLCCAGESNGLGSISKSNAELYVFPNPASRNEEIMISSNISFPAISNVNVQLVSIDGKVHNLTYQFNSERTLVLNSQGFSPGIYMVVIRDKGNNQILAARKLEIK